MYKLITRSSKVHYTTKRKLTTQPQETYIQWYKPDGAETGIRIYNCAARRKVPLILRNANYLTWYTCGPTVYDTTHLGHASCYVKLDIIQRILRTHFNYNLVTAMNITDIDDKIIQRSELTGQNWRDLARLHETQFWADLRKLHVGEPNLKVRVTEQIPRIVAFIEHILKLGLAYVGPDKSVYFNVAKFPIYGKLQKLNVDQSAVEQLKVVNKEAAADFALWKSSKSADEPSWPSPWGAGRPGWHIECSALASMIFGGTVDFHAGGLDLKFPHHENEEAQSCVYHNTKQWVNYWLHTGQLAIKGQAEKMSKSLKNTISVDEMLTQYTADDFRMACVLSNYRNKMEYDAEVMQTAQHTLQKFKNFNADCQAYFSGKKQGANDLNAISIMQQLSYTKEHVDACIKDDFDTARTIGVLLEQISAVSRGINANAVMDAMTTTRNESSLDSVAAVNNFVKQILSSFGFTFAKTDAAESSANEYDLNGLVDALLRTRESIRMRAVADKDKTLFQICDELRNCLQQHSIEIRDHSQGSTWNFVKK